MTTRLMAIIKKQTDQYLAGNGTIMPGDTVTIQAVTRTPDGAGSWTETWAAIWTGAGRLDPVSAGQTNVIGEQEALALLRNLTVTNDAPLLVDHRVIVGTETYEVRSLDDDTTWNIFKRALVAKVK